jgi:hypothetical protein
MKLGTLIRLLGAGILAFVAVVIAACSSGGGYPPTWDTPQQIKHVFVITLENEDYSTTFGANTKAPYLAQTLAAKGALVQQYYGTGHVSLDNYVSMISGQSPTTDTDNDCQTYQDFNLTGMTSDGQAIGTGCVYPASVQTLPDQLTAAGLTWKAYEEDMGNDPAREASACGHPTLNTADHTQVAEAPSTAVPLGDQYATRHNPYMYFHSIIDSPTCKQNVVNLNNLTTDLQNYATTANFIHITPNLCNDGHDAPCANGQPGGLTSANTFLQKWVPIIMASPAYQADGLLIINFDESGYVETVSPQSATQATTNITITFPGTICCNQQPGPNLAPFPQVVSEPLSATEVYTLSKQSYGGDQVGAVMLSQFIKPGTVSTVPYNHYSMLKSIEDIFGLSHLGYAGQAGLVGFGSDIFTNLPQ